MMINMFMIGNAAWLVELECISVLRTMNLTNFLQSMVYECNVK